MEALNVYKNQPIKSLLTVLILILGLYTIIFYQEIELKTIDAFVEAIISGGDNTHLLLTWFLNLASIACFLTIGTSWIKDSFRQEHSYYYDHDYTLGRIIGFITGTILILCSLFFIMYLFSKLLGVVIVIGLLFLWYFSQNNSKR